MGVLIAVWHRAYRCKNESGFLAKCRRALPDLRAPLRPVSRCPWQARYVRCVSCSKRRRSAKAARPSGAPARGKLPQPCRGQRLFDIETNNPRFRSVALAPRAQSKETVAGAVRALCRMVGAEMLRIACPGSGLARRTCTAGWAGRWQADGS